MKELRGSATATVRATPEECIAVIAAVDRYPTWYPDVIREVEVLERDAQGVARRARTKVHLAVGPLANDYRFEITVAVQPSAVLLSRVPNAGSDPERLESRWPRRSNVRVMRLLVARCSASSSVGAQSTQAAMAVRGPASSRSGAKRSR